MKVFYDYQIFEHQQFGGISRYFAELMGHMQGRDDINFILSLVESSNRYLAEIPEIAKKNLPQSDYYRSFLYGIEFPGKWRLYQQRNRWFPHYIQKNRLYTEALLTSASYDVFHPTDVDDYFLPLIGKRPFVITVHDMIDEYFPEYSFHVHSTYRTSLKEKLVRKAAAVIAVSEHTKKDLIERFSVDEKKITVIYHGPTVLPTAHNRPLVGGAYFLFVGKRVHYKNFYFLLQSIQQFLIKDPDLKIVCVGAPFTTAELSYFADLGIARNLVHVIAGDAELGNLYTFARAFIYPSMYEGFGMPILEAFQCRCPVITTNASSLPEVAGDAALYFQAKEMGQLRQAFESMLLNDALRKDLIEKGVQQLSKFSWRRASELTFEVYKSVL